MPCVEPVVPAPAIPGPGQRLPSLLLAASLLSLLSACSGPKPPAPAGVAATPAPPAAPVEARQVPADGRAPGPTAGLKLQPPKPVRNQEALRQQAAERLVAANPQRTYLGEVPQVLLAIPVLEIELHGDGSVRRIDVIRHPGQARDTTQLAIDAVHRAAPFGDVTRMPKPWKFTETFLFNDDRRFKPRTLDN